MESETLDEMAYDTRCPTSCLHLREYIFAKANNELFSRLLVLPECWYRHTFHGPAEIIQCCFSSRPLDELVHFAVDSLPKSLDLYLVQ